MTDVFNAPVTTGVDETKDYLAELVGEDKKFKTAADLAKGKAFADNHINTLTAELAEAKAELQRRKTEEDLLTRIKSMQNAGGNTEVTTPEVTESSSPKGLTPEDVERMFAERETKAAQARNLTSTVDALTQRFGDTVSQEIAKKAAELGTTTEAMRNMAQTQPKVFLALFGPAQTQPRDVFGAPAGSVRNAAAPPATPGDSWSAHEKVRRDNPNLYRSAGYQAALMKAAERAMIEGRYEKWKNS